MAVRGAKNRSRPQRQKPPERPKALRRASLIEVAAANQDAAEKEKNAFAIFQDTASPIYRQKQDEKKDLEGDPENGVPGSAAKEFKRCRPIVEMMEHVFTEPPTTDHVLFGEMLFPRVPIDAQTGRRQVRLIKGCQGLTADAEPGRYIGKLDKKGNPKLTPLADIETAGGSMTEDDWKAAAETRMAIFRARLDHGNGPGWKDFWKIKNETDERKRGVKSVRGKWARRFMFVKGCAGAYSSVMLPLTKMEPERDVDWHKQKVLNVSEVMSNDDDDNGWTHAITLFLQHCQQNGFDDFDIDRPWRELGSTEQTTRGNSNVPPGGPGRTSPSMMAASNREWVIQAVKNPKLHQFTYRVEARIVMQRAQDLSGGYRSFLKVTTRADSLLCLIDPVLRKLHFGSFTRDLQAKVQKSVETPMRRSSTAVRSAGGVTPKTEATPALDSLPEHSSQAESPALSSEQLSVQEGNGVESPATPVAVTTEMP